MNASTALKAITFRPSELQPSGLLICSMNVSWIASLYSESQYESQHRQNKRPSSPAHRATLGSMISMTQESEAYLQRSLDSTFFLSLETSMRANLANSPTSTLSNCLAVSIAMVFAFGTVGSINFLAFFTTRSKKTGCRATILVFLASFRMDGMD